jgi:hypothetical protein
VKVAESGVLETRPAHRRPIALAVHARASRVHSPGAEDAGVEPDLLRHPVFETGVETSLHLTFHGEQCDDDVVTRERIEL